MAETIKNIIDKYEDLHLIHIIKHDKVDKSTWEFEVPDNDCTLAGCCDSLSNYNYKCVTLRRGNHFFLAYKFIFGNDEEYYVDPRIANHRMSPEKYVNGLIDYSVLSNDISETKNTPSFKVTKKSMISKKIYNFLDLCYYFRDYSAIGTGYTRDLRNLVVMDIDLDCTRDDISQELNGLLMKFAECHSIPNFYIFNKESKHVQLQWLIQDYQYKDINQQLKDSVISDLRQDINKNKEITLFGTDFTKIDEPGIWYRKYTLSLCDIVKKRKFGDKNYTFWKAKNPMTALMGYYNLELRMPYLSAGEIKYLSQDDMMEIFSSRTLRTKYFDSSPDMNTLYENTRTLVDPYIENISDKQAKKKLDEDDKQTKKREKKIYGESRNNFVLHYTRNSTWEFAKKYGYRTLTDINSLDQKQLKALRDEVRKDVKNKFKSEDLKYQGHWPDTTNLSEYSNEEFKTTFNSSFNFALKKLNISTYDDEQRKKSQESRHLKKNMRLIIVDKLRQKNVSRDELLKLVNRTLKKCGQKEISLGSLKRYISESKSMSDEQRKHIYEEYVDGINDRKKQLDDAIEKNQSKKRINVCKKRYDYLSLKNT